MHIYKITNLINNKIYIGQTAQKNPKMRWYDHCRNAHTGKKSYLCDSLRKHGIDKFKWEIIDVANTIDELNILEEFWLAHYKAITKVYNIREAGNNKFHKQESIEKMRVAQVTAHARRKAQNGGIETMNRVIKTSGWKNSEQAKLNKSLAALRREAVKRGEL